MRLPSPCPLTGLHPAGRSLAQAVRESAPEKAKLAVTAGPGGDGEVKNGGRGEKVETLSLTKKAGIPLPTPMA